MIRSGEARTAIDGSGTIALSGATLDYQSPGQPPFHVTADSVNIDTDTGRVDIPATAVFYNDEGLRGTLQQVSFDSDSGDLKTAGTADITFPDGSTLQASTMQRVGDKQLWVFSQATLVLPDLPKSSFPPIPFVTSLWVVQ